MTSPLRVLIIGYVWPEPRSSAAGIRMLQIIECCLAQRWAVTFASPATPGPQRAGLAALGVDEQSIAVNDSAFDRWLCELQPDIVIFDRFMLEEQFGWRVAEHCPQALRVLESVDLHCLREARQRHLKEWLRESDGMQSGAVRSGGMAPGEQLIVAPQTADALYAQMAELDIAQREIAAIFRCDLTLIISDAEQRLLIDYFQVPEYLLCYLPLWMELPDTAMWPAFEQRADFISIGNFLHAPNWDATLLLKENIWPLIRAQLPQVRLFVYGAYPSQKVTQLHNPRQGFYIGGWVEDAQAALRAARICLAPLRFGAGIKGKLIDAMLSGTPSVTTSIGAEAMAPLDSSAAASGWAGAVADSAQSFADAAVRLYNDSKLWRLAQQRGLDILRQRFDPQRFADVLPKRLCHLREHLHAQRRRNFIGAMLQHHQHKSTHYMARWIEAKNIVQSTRSP